MGSDDPNCVNEMMKLKHKKIKVSFSVAQLATAFVQSALHSAATYCYVIMIRSDAPRNTVYLRLRLQINYTTIYSNKKDQTFNNGTLLCLKLRFVDRRPRKVLAGKTDPH